MTDEPEVLEGLLAVRATGGRSRSARESVVLVPEDGEPVTLHGRGATSLGVEPELAAYVGRHVRVTGTRAWSSFVVDHVEVMSDEP